MWHSLSVTLHVFCILCGFFFVHITRIRCLWERKVSVEEWECQRGILYFIEFVHIWGFYIFIFMSFPLVYMVILFIRLTIMEFVCKRKMRVRETYSVCQRRKSVRGVFGVLLTFVHEFFPHMSFSVIHIGFPLLTWSFCHFPQGHNNIIYLMTQIFNWYFRIFWSFF